MKFLFFDNVPDRELNPEAALKEALIEEESLYCIAI